MEHLNLKNSHSRALKCVYDLQIQQRNPEVFLQSHRNGSLVTGITQIISNIAYLESLCTSGEEIGNLHFQLLAVVSKTTGREQEIGDSEIASSTRHVLWDSLPVSNVREANPNSEEEVEVTPRIVSHQPENSVRYVNNVAGVYNISDDIAAKCFKYLIEGHAKPSNTTDKMNRQNLKQVRRREMVLILQRIFEEEAKMRNVALRNLTYTDLLPVELKGKDISLPVLEMNTSHGSEFRILKRVVVSLRGFGRPSLIKRDLAFAVLCVLLKAEDSRRGTAKHILENYARHGWERIEEENDTSLSAQRKGLEINMLYDKKRRKVASGSIIIPSSISIISGGYVSVNISKLNMSAIEEDLPIQKDDQFWNTSNRTSSQESINNRLMQHDIKWDINFIQRVKLFGDVDGDRVVIADAVCVGDIQELFEEDSTVENRIGSNDPRDAIVVANIKLVDGAFGDTIYPYKEWYEVGNIRLLRSQHFQDTEPPNSMIDCCSERCIAVLWSKWEKQELH